MSVIRGDRGLIINAKGDLLTFGTSPSRLAADTDGLFLTADSAQSLGMKWASLAGRLSGGSSDVIPKYTGANTLGASVLSEVSGDISSVPWQDYSATSTFTGWNSLSTKVVDYKTIGSFVIVHFSLLGPSSALLTGSFTLPFAPNGSAPITYHPMKTTNGANANTGMCDTTGGSTTVNLYNGWAPPGTYSGSGFNKGGQGTFWYQQ